MLDIMTGLLKIFCLQKGGMRHPNTLEASYERINSHTRRSSKSISQEIRRKSANVAKILRSAGVPPSEMSLTTCESTTPYSGSRQLQPLVADSIVGRTQRSRPKISDVRVVEPLSVSQITPVPLTGQVPLFLAVALLALLHLFDGRIGDRTLGILADDKENGDDESDETHKGERNLKRVHTQLFCRQSDSRFDWSSRD